MIAIVQQDDIAATRAPETTNYRSGRLGLPIPGEHGPHDHAKRAALRAALADDSIELGAAKAVRRTHPARSLAGDGFDSFVAAGEFVCYATRAHESERRVRFGMISDGMAALGDFTRKIGKEADVAADQEKCGAGLILVEQIKKRGRDGGIGAIVKGDRHGGWIAGAAHRRAEKLRSGRDRCPGQECTGTECTADGFDGGNWIHMCNFRTALKPPPVKVAQTAGTVSQR